MQAAHMIAVVGSLMIAPFCLRGADTIDEATASAAKDTNRVRQVLGFPFGSYSPETSLSLGVALWYSHYNKATAQATHPSSFTGKAQYSLKNQFEISGYYEHWNKKATTHSEYSLLYEYFPDRFFGTGNATLESNAEDYLERKVVANLVFDQAWKRPWFVGLTASTQYNSITRQEDSGLLARKSWLGEEGGWITYLGLSANYDTRDATAWTRKGSFARVNLSSSVPGPWTDYSVWRIRSDFRHFVPLNPKMGLGFHSTPEFVWGEVPFYQLREFGSKSIMRAYFPGRFRDEVLLAAQTEFRFRFHERLAMVFFIGAGDVMGFKDYKFRGLKTEFGFGGRLFVEPRSGITMRWDLAFSRDFFLNEWGRGFQLHGKEAF